jgi:hypothetical protein
VKKLEGRIDTCMDTWLKYFTEKACNLYKNMVSPAGIEPATPGLGILLAGFHKYLKIPEKALTAKQLQPLLT